MPIPDPNQNQSSVPVSGSTVPNSGSPASDTYRPLFGAPQVAADDTYRPLATDTPAQQEPPAPEEKPGALHRLWDWANRGIISKDTMVKAMTGMSPDDLNEALSPFADETPMHAALREFTRGTLQDIGALGSSLTSPLSVGTIAGGELIKGAQSTTQVAAALKGVRAAEASVSAADVAYTARITEATNATAQADRAVQAARAAEAAETAGKGSRAATIAAQNTASEAVANASRARQALQEAQAAQREAAVQAARATYAHQEAAKAASLIPIPGQVAKAAPVVRTLGGLFAAQGIEQAATGRQEGETPEDEIERRLMGLGFATLAAEGFKGSKMDVSLSEVPARAVDFGKDGVEMTKKAAQKAVDLVSGSLGVSQDFDTVVKNISKPSAKQYQNYVDKIENVSDDLKAILNANKDVEDPKGFANAIDGHIKRQEGILQAQAGATKNSPEPVVPDIMNRVSQSLDKFFDENRGAYGSDTDVAEAKKKLLERVFQTRGTQQMQPPNLFEAENIRWSLGQESKPQFAANAVPTTNAYKAGAAEIANVLRDAVDESYNNKGVKDVKEWRQKEANLIDIRDRLKLAQAKADALGQPGIWKSMFAKVGTPSAIIAAAFGHPIGVGMLAAGMTGDYIHQLATNPNSLVQRAVKLAAREPAAQVAQPTVSPWVSPAPPATPAQLGPVPSGGAPTPAATPVPGAATEEFVPPSRENTDLHSSLATHYGKSIKNTNYADLEARFHNDVKTKTEHGVDLDTSEKTILGKINASDAKDTKAAEKAREKAAKEQEKTIKEAQESYRPLVETKDLENLQQVSIQKLKEMAAEVPEFVKDLSIQKNSLSSGTVGQLNYKGKPLFYLGVPLAELEEELGPIKKVLGKAADVLTKGQDVDAEATFKHLTRMPQTEYKVPAGGLMPSPPNELSTPEQTNYHELGHVFAGHLNGFKADEIGSRLNPENPAGAAAYTKFHFEELGDEKGRVTRESLGNKLPNLLETLMGGAAADEVHSGLDRFNAGTENDRLVAYRLLTQGLGMSHNEAADLIETATDRAAEKLKHPVTHGILKENAGVREEGLPDTHLFSKERLESMRQEHDRRMEEYEKQNRAGGSRAGRKGYEGLDTRAAQAGGGPVAEGVSRKLPEGVKLDNAWEEFGPSIKKLTARDEAGKDIGHITIDKSDESRPFIGMSSVDGPWQGKGIGESLYRAAIEDARKSGAKDFRSDVDPSDDAERVWKKLAASGDYNISQDAKDRWVVNFEPKAQWVAQTAVLSPAERSTGNPEHDAMIKAAGAVPGGVQEGVKGIVPDFTMFHDPLTGSTLAVPVDELTEQAVRDKLADSRKKFKLTQTAQTKLPPQPRLPDTGTYAAIKTDDGSIYFDDEPEKQRTHIMLAKDLNIPPERIVSGGWFKDGDYEAAERSDAGRWGEQARAKQLVENKRQRQQTVHQTAQELAKIIGGKVVGSAAEAGTTPNDIDIRVENHNDESFENSGIAKNLEAKGFKYTSSQLVSPKEAQESGKPYATGWQRAENFEGLNGQKLDVWHDVETQDQQKGLISTRLPSSKKSTENPITQDLTIGRQAIEQVPGMADKMAKLVRKYPGFKIPENIKDPAKVLDRFVSHVKENLKQLYNNVPPEVQAANSRWYDSANGLAQRLSEKYGTTMNQMAGAIAAMSPQKDWDQNVSLAERVNDIYHTKQDVETTPEMLVKAKEIASRKTGRTFKPMAKALAGKTLSELTKPIERAAWVRLYDEAHNPREYQSIDPATGEGRGIVHTAAGQPQRVSWGGLNEVGKALSILQDGSRENISNNLGDAHKVRNFYNNIVDPNNPRGDVTIDTHAVAAGLVRPLGGNSTEVLHNFGAGGAPGSVVNGVNGTYPLYADAYREAAKELGIQPRQLQSVVWEHVRNIFPGEIKRQPSLVDAVNNIWKDYADRKISLDKAHELVRQSANQAVQGLVSKRKISPEDFQKEIGKGGLQALGGEK